MPQAALKAFAHYYERLQSADPGVLPERRLEPARAIPTVDELPRDETKGSGVLGRTIVLKLNGALGQAWGSGAWRVPRRRFAPVKTTDDLLEVRSDAYVLADEGHVELAPRRGERPPVVELDPRFYKLLPDFEARFPAGAPSLVACERLKVVGDVRFGRGVVVRGSATVEHAGHGQLQIEDGVVLED